MADAVVVPIRLDALVLEREVDVVAGAADFSRLPYVDPETGRDRETDAPYLSEQVLPVPFQDENLRLKTGVHLHWTLPDALTRLVQRDGETVVRVVPNRWLVTRTVNGVVERQWVVESDFLAPVGDEGGGIAFPLTGPVPFRRLGRALPLAAWLLAPGGDSLPELTAVGYGEPAFAALYPNCHSVFGLRDPDPVAPGTVYDVVGWWVDLAQDPVASLGADWKAQLLDGYGWDVAGVAHPARTVCYARLSFRPETSPASDDTAGVYVGTTATEALAAHLGAVLPGRTADQIEDLLEALSFADELEAKPLDVGIKLEESRHAVGFRPVPAGTLWTVRREDAAQVSAAQRQQRENLSLSHQLGDLLDALNTAQEDHDQAADMLRSLREQLFADWYKYLLCAYPYETQRDSYPDPDLVRHYLERHMAVIETRTSQLDTLALAVQKAANDLDVALTAFNQTQAEPCGAKFLRDTVAAPQHYQPAEPVVLLTGSPAAPSERYGQDGVLACPVVDLRDLTDPASMQRVLAPRDLPTTVWRGDPWHPVLLQWEAEFFPAGTGGNLDPAGHAYAQTYISANYELGPVDLTPRPGHDLPDKAANVYQGTTILSSNAQPVLSGRILRYLAATVLDAYRDGTGDAISAQDFQDAPATVLDWYSAHGTDERLKILIEAYRHLVGHERDNLAQSLGGLNDALVMRRLTRQLPIADPLGFPSYQRFAERVAAAVGDDVRHAPHPLSDFNPIRAGALRINRLRIVDNFGRAREIDTNGLATTTRLRIEGRPGWIAMPPRLAQPARLSARWLDSDHELRQMNDVPVTSPVCGWLIGDDLDDGLAVHDADGILLGVLQALPQPGDATKARWSAAPGGPIATVGQIQNDHLREVAVWLQALGPSRLAEYLSTVDTALASSEPEDHGAGVLTARPLAVVRAELDLQLQGLPAVDQDWNVFRQDLRRSSRDDGDFPLVRFPVRIGNADRLNDGLISLWDGAELRTGEAVLELALDLSPRRVTMLIDPRAPIHVTSGILPAKSLWIPPEQYRPALNGMKVAFFTAPVLTDGDLLAIPVPDEPGHRWAWRSRGPAGWTDQDVDDVRPGLGFPNQPTLREGWLTLVPVSDTE